MEERVQDGLRQERISAEVAAPVNVKQEEDGKPNRPWFSKGRSRRKEGTPVQLVARVIDDSPPLMAKGAGDSKSGGGVDSKDKAAGDPELPVRRSLSAELIE